LDLRNALVIGLLFDLHRLPFKHAQVLVSAQRILHFLLDVAQLANFLIMERDCRLFTYLSISWVRHGIKLGT